MMSFMDGPMAQFLDFKDDFLNIYSEYVYANIKVLDMSTGNGVHVGYPTRMKSTHKK